MAQEQAHVEFASVLVLQPSVEPSVVATLRNGDLFVDFYCVADGDSGYLSGISDAPCSVSYAYS